MHSRFPYQTDGHASAKARQTLLPPVAVRRIEKLHSSQAFAITLMGCSLFCSPLALFAFGFLLIRLCQCLNLQGEYPQLKNSKSRLAGKLKSAQNIYLAGTLISAAVCLLAAVIALVGVLLFIPIS